MAQMKETTPSDLSMVIVGRKGAERNAIGMAVAEPSQARPLVCNCLLALWRRSGNVREARLDSFISAPK